MRKLLILLFLILDITVHCQTNDSIDAVIIDKVEKMPVFPGGTKALTCFLENNFNLDILNMGQNKVRHFVTFRIDTLGYAGEFSFIATRPGKIDNAHIDSLKRAEILRVLNLMPKWEPALQNGRNIAVWLTIAVNTPYNKFYCKKTPGMVGKEN